MPESPAARPRLAYVVHTLNPGGTERLAVDMALAFADRFDVLVVCLDELGLWAADLTARGIPVHCVERKPGLDIGVAVRLARLFRKHRIDLIHAHQCTPWFYAGLSRLFHRSPKLLLEEHGRFHPEIPNAKRVALNRLLVRPLTQAFVAVSADIRNRLVRYEGLRHADIEVVYNGVKPPVLIEGEREALRTELGFDRDDIVIGTVGRLDPIKNLPLLLRAFADQVTHYPRLRLVIVGEGPERPALEQLISSLGLGSRVTMTGFRSDARRVLQAFDVFALVSFSEGTSMALLEAMSAAVPVVVTAVGGNPEIVRDGQTGLMVPSDDAQALSTALGKLLGDSDVRTSFGAAARADFQARFSFDAMTARYATLYDQMLSAAS